MDQKGISAVVGLLAFAMLVGLPFGVLPKSKDSGARGQTGSKQETEKNESEEKKDESVPKVDVWEHGTRLYREYFKPGTEGAGESGFREVLKAKGDYELEFVIALVPDPLDSQLPAGFDQALEGIQQAYVDSGYLLDRLWLPWSENKALKTGIHRKTPGMLLFRKRKSDTEKTRKLATVLLVGESPKSGIQKEAFGNAVRMSVLGGSTWIRVIGPSFSGSAESLRLALSLYKGHGNPNTATAGPAIRFEIVSGTATGEGLAQQFADLGPSVRFCRTVVPDNALWDTSLDHLFERMGWKRRRLALLTEADTAYGKGTPEKDDEAKITRAEFPSGMADVRTAWEERGGLKAIDQSGLIAQPKLALELSLMRRGEPRDLIPSFDPLGVAESDLALSSLLKTISRERLRYVGLRATDVRDKLFLAEQIQRYCPDVVLFTLDSDLLYGHPEVGEAMDSMLVFSNFPLYTEGQKGLPQGLSAQTFRKLRQFGSEFQQGIFKAARYVLESRPGLQIAGNRTPRHVWISAVGNGSIWPVAKVPVNISKHSLDDLCTTAGSTEYLPEPRKQRFSELAERKDLQLLFFMVVVYLLASLLDRIVVPPDLVEDLYRVVYPSTLQRPRWVRKVADRLWPPDKPEGKVPAWRRRGAAALRTVARWGDRVSEWNDRAAISRTRAMVLGIAVLWVAGSLVLLLGLFPRWFGQGVEVSEILIYGLPLFYVLFVWRLGLLAWPYFKPAARSLFPWAGWTPTVLWAAIGLLLPVVLGAILLRLWVLKDPEIFYFRVRAFASGLSPLVPLAWVGAALYAWAALEMRRLRLLVRHAPEWPLQQAREPVLRSLPLAADQLRRFLLDTRLPGSWRRVGIFIVLVPPLFLLWHSVQPIAEAKNYGRVFLVLCSAALILGGISFYRFVSIWLLLEKILQRLEHTSLIKAFGKLSKKVGWNPMRSFWQIPAFNVVLLSVQKIELIERCKKLPLQAFRECINVALDSAFEARRSDPFRKGSYARRKEPFRQEIQARQEMQDAFKDLGVLLSDHRKEPVVELFYAIRIVSYIRHCFLHMRNCLIAALVSGVFTLTAVTTYAFEPKQFLSLALWLVFVAAVVFTIWIFVQMDRNAVLSRIGGSEPGKVTFDRVFILNVLTYGVVPLLSVIATQFPDLSSQLLRWANPVLRVAGVD